MLAICKSNRGADIPPSRRYLGEQEQTDYNPLTFGEHYQVYGLLFVVDRVDFLVRAVDQPPFWVPGDLFDLTDPSIPFGWEFRNTRSSLEYAALSDCFGINYIAGYSLLVKDYRHYLGLIEREPREVQRFIEEIEK